MEKSPNGPETGAASSLIQAADAEPMPTPQEIAAATKPTNAFTELSLDACTVTTASMLPFSPTHADRSLP